MENVAQLKTKLTELIAIKTKENLLTFAEACGYKEIEEKTFDVLRVDLSEYLTKKLVELALLEVQKENEASETKDEERLKTETEKIYKEAAEINKAFASAKTPEEIEALIQELDNKYFIGDLVRNALAPNIAQFSTFAASGQVLPSNQNFVAVAPTGSVQTFAFSPVTNDLPLSLIVTNLPVRVFEQVLHTTSVNYPLMGLFPKRNVVNGILDKFYQDYTDGDAISAYSDVVIGDFNGLSEPVFKETYQVKTEYHKQYKILSSLLNEVTITIGLFVALMNSFTNAILKPFAKELYSFVITNLFDTAISGTTANAFYDEIITFAGSSVSDNQKLAYTTLQSKMTPSRDNLKKRPTGSSQALEYQMKTENMVVIMNAAYAANWTFDVSSKLFHFDQVALPVSKIIIQDFTKLEAYSKNSTKNLGKYEIILVEKNAAELLFHYQANKLVQTPKLFEVAHQYARYDVLVRKDKLCVAFKRNGA